MFSGWFEAYPGGDRLVLKPATFKDLPGWEEDMLEEAVPVFLRSCRVLTATPGDWQAACDAAARRFFEANFRPWSVPGDGRVRAGLNRPLRRGQA